MGLIKTDGYDIKGVTITPAYTKITRIHIEDDNTANVFFGISNTRENIETNRPLEEITFQCEIDRTQDNIFNEVYTKAKEELFTDWQDDIVTEEPIAEE